MSDFLLTFAPLNNPMTDYITHEVARVMGQKLG